MDLQSLHVALAPVSPKLALLQMLEKKKEVGQPVNGVKTAVAKQKTRPQAPMTGKDAAASLAATAPAPAQPSAGAAQPSSSSSSSGVHAARLMTQPASAPWYDQDIVGNSMYQDDRSEAGIGAC
jgi:hypothetical protein